MFYKIINVTDDQKKNPGQKLKNSKSGLLWERGMWVYKQTQLQHTHIYTWHASVAGESQLPGNKKGVMERGG